MLPLNASLSISILAHKCNVQLNNEGKLFSLYHRDNCLEDVYMSVCVFVNEAKILNEIWRFYKMLSELNFQREFHSYGLLLTGSYYIFSFSTNILNVHININVHICNFRIILYWNWRQCKAIKLFKNNYKFLFS